VSAGTFVIFCKFPALSDYDVPHRILEFHEIIEAGFGGRYRDMGKLFEGASFVGYTGWGDFVHPTPNDAMAYPDVVSASGDSHFC
jgi:hypothetical protein